MFRPFPYARLLAWYAQNGRHDLPWRKSHDPYRVWLSEILLQQTQAPRVVEFFNRIVKRYPTVESLAEATFEEFFPYYDGLGYYSRARNLLATAKIVAGEMDGVFPVETAGLVQLPGIGPYTAEAIRAFAFDLPTLSFDTNLEKVFSRYYFWDRFKKLSKDEKAEILADFQRQSRASVRRDGAAEISARHVNAALMDFSTIKAPNAKSKVDWDSYPLEDCVFFQTRGANELEKRSVKTAFPMKDAKLVAILSDAHGKTLFSSMEKDDCETYAPFILPPPEETDPREAIKRHFLKMGLAVSVRPPYSKGFLNGEPLAFFRVRIQTGEKGFAAFEKMEFKDWWDRWSLGKSVDFWENPIRGKLDTTES